MNAKWLWTHANLTQLALTRVAVIHAFVPLATLMAPAVFAKTSTSA